MLVFMKKHLCPSRLRLLAAVLIMTSVASFCFAAEPAFVIEKDLSYLEGDDLAKADAYRRSQCRMDLSLPTGKPGFPTLIWLHGGGLTGGKRSFPGNLKKDDLGIVAVSYRLSPKAEHPAWLEDTAAATAWVFRHIAERGGDPKKIFLSGHSAGGYLAAMVGMDPRWLNAYGISHRDLAGLIPVSAQVTTHFLVKKLRGDTGAQFRPIIDEMAPLYYVSKDLPPICLVLGDRAIEFKSRVEENDLMAVSLRNLGHPMVEFHEMGGLDHGTVFPGAQIIMPGFIKRVIDRQSQ